MARMADAHYPVIDNVAPAGASWWGFVSPEIRQYIGDQGHVFVTSEQLLMAELIVQLRKACALCRPDTTRD